MELDRVRKLMDLLGVNRTPWLGRIDFWIVRLEAIETAYQLAVGFWHKAKEADFSVEVSACLAFAEQMPGGGHRNASAGTPPRSVGGVRPPAGAPLACPTESRGSGSRLGAASRRRSARPSSDCPPTGSRPDSVLLHPAMDRRPEIWAGYISRLLKEATDRETARNHTSSPRLWRVSGGSVDTTSAPGSFFGVCASSPSYSSLSPP